MRYAERERYLVHVRCVKQACARHAILLLKRFVLTAMILVVRYVESTYHREHATSVVSWFVKIMERGSMNLQYVTVVGRVTYEQEASSNWNG